MNYNYETELNRSIVGSMNERSIDIRRMILDTMLISGRGHLASAFSLVEILITLYDHILKINPSQLDKEDRDRFILSKGHGCLALYAILADKGFISHQDLESFCCLDSILGGHPEFPRIPGIEASTGSLGHGPSIGVGIAVATVKTAARVFVVLGDGECNEGSVWESALSAAKHGLDRLTLIIDYNKHQSFGTTSEVCSLEPFAAKWRAFGFSVSECDGHDIEAMKAIFESLPFTKGKPSVVICHTIKGAGIPITEHNLEWHHKSKFSEDDYSKLLTSLVDH
jgi:transketolase